MTAVKSVSIHAPTRGATSGAGEAGVLRLVSIHAPTRGATWRQPPKARKTTVSIHAPTRGATQGIKDQNDLVNVSIHAPTRGATYNSPAAQMSRMVSIHAPTRGATNTTFNIWAKIKFQSTHPHGVRLRLRLIRRNLQRFNPRTHTGCDTTSALISVAALVSIHAPTRGAMRY